MNDINKLKEQQKDAHPGFSSYLECMTRTLFGGLATFSLTFASTYFGQALLKSRLPYSQNLFILVSSLVSSGLAYQYTSRGTKNCQAGWMASEDKWTYLKETVQNDEK